MISGSVHYQLILWAGVIISGAVAALVARTPMGDWILYWMIGLLGGVAGMGAAALKISRDKIRESRQRRIL